MIPVRPKKQVSIAEKTLLLPIESLTAEGTPKNAAIHISISRYENQLIAIINQTGTIGSLLQGFLESEAEDDYIYSISTLFGAGDNQFYEILFRRILQLVYEDPQRPVDRNYKVQMFCSLPLKSKDFNGSVYYKGLVDQLTAMVPSTF